MKLCVSNILFSFLFSIVCFYIFSFLMYSRICTYGHVGCLVLILPCWMWSCLLSQTTKSKILLCLPILSQVSICFQICCQWYHQQFNILKVLCNRQLKLKKHISVKGRDKSLEICSKFEIQSTSQKEDQFLIFESNILKLSSTMIKMICLPSQLLFPRLSVTPWLYVVCSSLDSILLVLYYIHIWKVKARW